MNNFEEKDVQELIEGKTIESAQIGVKTIVIKFKDGSYLDVDIIEDENETGRWRHQMKAKLSEK